MPFTIVSTIVQTIDILTYEHYIKQRTYFSSTKPFNNNNVLLIMADVLTYIHMNNTKHSLTLNSFQFFIPIEFFVCVSCTYPFMLPFVLTWRQMWDTVI